MPCGVQRKRAQGQGRNIDPRPTPAVVAGVLDVAAGGSGGLDNIRRHGRTGDTVVGGRNAAIVLVRKVHHEIDRVFVRGRVVGIRRGPCGGIIVLGGGERLGGQQSHAQAERQHHAQYAGRKNLNYLATILTILFGITMTFLTSFPSKNF